MVRMAVISHHGREPAGAENTLVTLLKRLPASVEPSFFLFEDGAFAEQLRRLFGAVTIVPMSNRIAGATRRRLRADAVMDAVNLLYRLSDALRRQRVDIVVTNSMKAHVIGSIAARALRRPCLNFMHDIPEGIALRLLREISRRCADERLACSGAVLRNLKLPQTTVAYPPIDTSHIERQPDAATARTALGIPNDGLPLVGIVGRIAPLKGQDRFIRIAAQVRKRFDARFAIVGSPLFGCDPGYMTLLRHLVDDCGMSERIHFAPWQECVRNVYAALDVSCNCSTREGFGATSAEALACGVPVVCFDDAGICELFTPDCGGTAVPARDERAFADAICRYLQDPIFMERARNAARASAEKLGGAEAAQPFLGAIERLIGRARSRRNQSNNTTIEMRGARCR